MTRQTKVPLPKPHKDNSSIRPSRRTTAPLVEDDELFDRDDLEAWLLEQVADPCRHEASDRERLTRVLTDISLASLSSRARLLALVARMLDETAAIRRRGEALAPTAYLLRVLDLPADFYERRDAARRAAMLEDASSRGGGARPRRGSRLFGGASDLARIARESEGLRDDPRYEDRALDAARPPFERMLSRLLVERGDRYSDDDFDLALEAVTTSGVPLPRMSDDVLRRFALDWLEAVHALLPATADDGADGPECDAVEIGVLCARVERRGGVVARAYATRAIEHLFATRATFAHSEDDFRRGRYSALGKAPRWPALLAAARERSPAVPEATWQRMAERPCRTVGAPTVSDLVRLAAAIAREPRPLTLAERVAVAAERRLRDPLPTPAPGQCQQRRERVMDDGSVTEVCPAPATTTALELDETRRLCGPCAEVARMVWAFNERVLHHARTHRQGRRATG